MRGVLDGVPNLHRASVGRGRDMEGLRRIAD